ncbi:uncharacterized protein NECHADRAFT_87857 [Fusarium vanettenii 77-13-4]|uniref:Peptidase C14 caspase domain-containing protein n=1 Tax=Fusarium vanettenii (strain ATCC MYA-4622 / CBS 123669 / FGSC 9596 / NRRL 45880 / 77-13-4) TaxID=660122 RepID=C7Z380_FUSV7|nr:uncharacterized protein NECHADRAFT_87857 [Fusarium vanettenii 77-13-4]EEU41611.1 predicted protein [Fusarium vanettenii 77-13-4]
MVTKTPSGNKIALVVGVDKYLNGTKQDGHGIKKDDSGTRKDEEGNPVCLDNLCGCENDALDVKRMLEAKFGITDTTVMISSSSVTAELPTYQNIKGAFDKVTNTAQKGDLFFFHFSGHGARLNTNRRPPTGHAKDPSLLPMDFCQGQPAIRGWVLNQWLQKLHGKGVQVVVSLDSCYSGGAWRTDGRKRTTDENWKAPVNLPVDKEQASSAGSVVSTDRNSIPIDSWGINPYNFTLMAACKPNQPAQECRQDDGKIHGVFTSALVSHLDSDTPLKTYRTVCAAINATFSRPARNITQTPEVHGHDRLQVFGTTEPCCPMLLYVRVGDRLVRIPEGEIHGVNRGTEYTRLSKPTGHKLVVDEVEDTYCLVKMPKEDRSVWNTGDELYRSRLSTSCLFRVLVDPGLPSAFTSSLLKTLRQHIQGSVEAVTASSHTDRSTSAVELKRTNDGIELLKLHPGGVETVPGLVLSCTNDQECEQLVAPSASAIVHLFRYQQILDLRTLASKTKPPFTVKFMDEERSRELSNGQSVPSCIKVRLVFTNRSDATLYFTVLSFGPGHQVKQLYPGSPQCSCSVVSDGSNQDCLFKLELPDELQNGFGKDMLRTVVTDSSNVSLKSLEMPDIWIKEQKFHSTGGTVRNAELIQDLKWWIDDFEVEVLTED